MFENSSDSLELDCNSKYSPGLTWTIYIDTISYILFLFAVVSRFVTLKVFKIIDSNLTLLQIKIIRGKYADDNEFKSVVVLQRIDNFNVDAGALISYCNVLTAAHCVYRHIHVHEPKYSVLSILVGTHNIITIIALFRNILLIMTSQC